MFDGIPINRIAAAAVTVILLVFMGCTSGSLFENLNASEQMIVQYPNGNMETFTTPGIKPQWLGKVTKYDKRANYDFLAAERGAKTGNQSIEVRFNDGGHGHISGSIAWEMPADPKSFLRLHALYGTQEAVERKLVANVVNKAVYMTGPLMSSRESYAERRNDLLSLIDDQIKNGVYRTRTIQRKETDPLTGQERTVSFVQVIQDSSGHFARQDHSPLSDNGVTTFNLSINGVIYDDTVEDQIKQQQAMTMAVQTAMMKAKQAEQDAITAKANGEAEAAKAKWTQEALKATAVTAAEQERDVARLRADAAEAYKRQQILEGEGDGAKKRLIMQADGALERKLAAWVEINQAYAAAISAYQGAWVPGVVMGADGASRMPASGAQQMIDMLSVKTARDLGLDMRVVQSAPASSKRR